MTFETIAQQITEAPRPNSKLTRNVGGCIHHIYNRLSGGLLDDKCPHGQIATGA